MFIFYINKIMKINYVHFVNILDIYRLKVYNYIKFMMESKSLTLLSFKVWVEW